ncbi:TPA: hypothetical protein JG853_005396 [Vibrio parahaemolyticus]|nr:hypothetical protein [Vibrio parahaemolyticus]HAV1411177.1 hypothetical protein [Vibrio parahaemolyticus]
MSRGVLAPITANQQHSISLSMPTSVDSHAWEWLDSDSPFLSVIIRIRVDAFAFLNNMHFEI